MDKFRPFRGGLLPAHRRISTHSIRLVLVSLVFICGVLTLSFAGHTQTPQTARGVIRLKVRYKSGDVTKELPRKRFFLIKGSLDDNKSLAEIMRQTTANSRECYYRSKGATEQLIKWLDDNDCESIYCRAIEERDLSGNDAVPEFKTAYGQALIELKTADLARRWLTNYLPAEIRDGYYRTRQRTLDGLIAQAEKLSGKPVMSIMTDRKGTAYLTDIEPGTYTISNLIPSETDKSNILWLCEREVKAADLSIAMRRPFILSNEKDPKVKCEVIEAPLPVCGK
jgi:hypothetical protein